MPEPIMLPTTSARHIQKPSRRGASGTALGRWGDAMTGEHGRWSEEVKLLIPSPMGERIG
jgi:hypothetical protein